MNTIDKQLLRDAVTIDTLKPFVVMLAPRGGAECPGCRTNMPAGRILVGSKAWPIVAASCRANCILRVVRDGCVEAPLDWAAEP